MLSSIQRRYAGATLDALLIKHHPGREAPRRPLARGARAVHGAVGARAREPGLSELTPVGTRSLQPRGPDPRPRNTIPPEKPNAIAHYENLIQNPRDRSCAEWRPARPSAVNSPFTSGSALVGAGSAGRRYRGSPSHTPVEIRSKCVRSSYAQTRIRESKG